MVRQASEHGELAEPHERNINNLHRSPWACRRASWLFTRPSS